MAHLFCALSVLVSASLLARLTAKYSEKSTPWCKALENSSSDARCYQLIIGVVSIDNNLWRTGICNYDVTSTNNSFHDVDMTSFLLTAANCKASKTSKHLVLTYFI